MGAARLTRHNWQLCRTQEEAVSPVVGVILMVAVTVVLAATVFVVVNGLNRGTTAPAAISFQVNHPNDRLETIAAEEGADWSQVSVTAKSCNAPTAVIFVAASSAPHNDLQATALSRTAIATAGCASPQPVQIASSPTAIAAGSFLAFCSSVAVSNVEIQLVQSDSNSQVATYTIPTVAPCA